MEDEDLQVGGEHILTGVCGGATPPAEACSSRSMGGLRRSSDSFGRRATVHSDMDSLLSSFWRTAFFLQE